MKTVVVYGVIVAVFFLLGISLVALYYTQDAKERFNFKDSINYGELELQTNQKGITPYLSSAKGTVGKLILTNNGIFPQVYNIPQLAGCIDLKEGVSQEQAQIRNYQFQIVFLQDGISYYAGQRIEIPVGKEQEFDMVGEYYSYDVPLSTFSSDTIKSVSIYKIKEGKTNPINNNINYKYYYGKSYYGDNCNNLRTQYRPEETIPLD
ncbi:hypothetical protein HYV50_04310 [Candidatus Pacearchaeota archaeon]|nr:hypothetical protein [Candidatus Pacearchaeota archaeon]